MIRTDDTARGRLGAGVDASVEDRLPLLVVVILLVFGAFIVRLFQLQIIMGEVFAEESDKNSVRLVRLEAPRGDILDREGRVIATTRPAFGLQVLPSDLRNPDLAFRALSQLLGEDASGLREQVGEARGRARFQPVRLAGDLSYDRLASVESHLYALPGVMTDVRPRRDYVGADLAAHVLGYLGEVQRSQLETRDYVGYRSGDVIGQAGIEALEQSHLRGRDGGRNVVVDVRGRVVDVLDEEDPVAGGSVTLTLDLDLQRIAEEAFQPDAIGEPAEDGGARRDGRQHRRRARAGLEALVRPQRLRGRRERRHLEGAHHGRVEAAAESCDLGAVPARVDLQGDRRGGGPPGAA